MSGLNGGRVNIAACSIGGAQWALERALRYVHERESFGAPLAANQSIVFTLADMETELQAARALAAARRREARRGRARHGDRRARWRSDSRPTPHSRVANSALQLHGGYGYLHEYGIERVVRDLRVHQILEGTNEIMRLIVGRNLVNRL